MGGKEFWNKYIASVFDMSLNFFKYYHAQCFFFKFLLLLNINHFLRLRTGWLKIEDWMKMGQLLGGGEVVKNGCWVVTSSRCWWSLDWKMCCHLKSAVDVICWFYQKRRKCTFCMGNYYLEMFLQGLFDILHLYRRYCLKANRNLGLVFHFRTHSVR